MRGDANARVVARRWPRNRAAVGRARAELRKTLAGWGLTDLEDGASVVLSELLSNSVLHARVPRDRQVKTQFSEEANGVRIEVHDASEAWPDEQVPGLDSEFGRGLLLVSALAADWGVGERVGPGKSVWAVVTNDSAGSGSRRTEHP